MDAAQLQQRSPEDSSHEQKEGTHRNLQGHDDRSHLHSGRRSNGTKAQIKV
jgi:hypothetical protein